MDSKKSGWTTTARAVKLAIVGMDVCFGGAGNLVDFESALYSGSGRTRFSQDPVASEPQAGLLIFGAASGSWDHLTREERLLLKVAGGALQDAGLGGGPGADDRVGLVYSLGRALVSATAWAAAQKQADQPGSLANRCQFTEPALDLSGRGNPLAEGLFEASSLLEGGTVDAVVTGAVMLSESTKRLFQDMPVKWHDGQLTLGFDQGLDGWTSGEGACALVVMHLADARRLGKRIYAVIDAVGLVCRDAPRPIKSILPGFISSETIWQSCQAAFETSRAEPGQIGYLETLASGFTPVDIAEITGLARAYRSAGPGLTCAVGSVQANTGYLFNVSGLAGLVRAVLSLYHRCLPASPQWLAPKKPELWEEAPFYVPVEARTWFLPPGQNSRAAAVNAIGWDGSCAHLILSEEISQANRPNHFLKQSPFYLFPLAGDRPEEILNALAGLQQSLLESGDVAGEARRNFESYRQKPRAEFALAITGHDLAEIQRELDAAEKGIPTAIEKRTSWQTPLGSCFSADPVGKQGSVAFVYPGAFNSYLGLGKDLFLLFPELYDRMAHLTSDLGATIQDEQLYPRSLSALSKEQLASREAELNSDPIAMITTGSLMAVLFTMILRDVFKVRPAAAFGYSLGEIAMLFGTGVWYEADATRARLTQSPLFRTRLSGPQQAVREFWGGDSLPNGALWSNYFLMAPAEQVAEAVRQVERVYLTHINTPRQVVIAGDPAGCQRVIAALRCTSLKAPFDFALHCEAMRSEYPALVDLHTWPIAAQTEPVLYSAADDRPLAMDSQAIADRVSRMLCSPLDFPRLVRQVYAGGARVFIELGANANCSKWIEDTLKGSPCLAVSINRRGADDHTSLVRLLARLVSQRVPVDLSPLYR